MVRFHPGAPFLKKVTNMNVEEQTLLKLFEMKHGTMSNKFSVVVEYDIDTMRPNAVNLHNDNGFCWGESATDLLLWYVGNQLGIKE